MSFELADGQYSTCPLLSSQIYFSLCLILIFSSFIPPKYSILFRKLLIFSSFCLGVRQDLDFSACITLYLSLSFYILYPSESQSSSTSLFVAWVLLVAWGKQVVLCGLLALLFIIHEGTLRNSERVSFQEILGTYICIMARGVKNYQMNSTKGLISFDLDDTIAGGCVEAYFFQGVPHKQLFQLFSSKLPWCSVVQSLLAKPVKNRTFEKAREVYQTLPINEGMGDLIRYLHAGGYELILVTGANKMFAEDYLKQKKLDQCFTEIIANSMEYCETDGFKYSPFCLKTVRCSSSNCRPPCKRKLIEDYLKEKGRSIELIYHVGDGHNDFCPMTLTKGAKAFVRKDHVLHDDLESNKELVKEIPGELVYWTSGFDIISHFQKP